MTILTEDSNKATQSIDLMRGEEIAKTINSEDKKVAYAVEKELPQIGKAIDVIAEAFKKGGRLAYFGAGTSGRIGVLDASECVPTFSVDENMVKGFMAGGDFALRHSVEGAEDSIEEALNDLKAFNPKKHDVVVAISASGNPQYMITILQTAHEKGLKTIAVTSNPKAKFKAFADIFICTLVGAEAITGSSRMKSGTAQKMVLNMLSTGAMIRIGKVYKNYMIDVKLLNEKLIKRGRRFVCEICNIDEKEAADFLKKSGNNVKIACIMQKKNCTKEEAEKLLSDAGGFLRKVID